MLGGVKEAGRERKGIGGRRQAGRRKGGGEDEGGTHVSGAHVIKLFWVVRVEWHGGGESELVGMKKSPHSLPSLHGSTLKIWLSLLERRRQGEGSEGKSEAG
ncbi:hypothetical protein E2C01_074990 [Portunus trituberculatus]|uniref:Uncharacterized protein n=1 Tax=Portunus trituberculatus TaxID=210409 RepID=A0A5B7I4W3_PORTR|nr:hypothetical protein [Portunus trituberculatus]